MLLLICIFFYKKKFKLININFVKLFERKKIILTIRIKNKKMNKETSFIRKSERYKLLMELFEHRKEWFIHSLSTAVESVTSDEFVYQMFQVPSSKLYIPDRVCEIVTSSIEDDRELFIDQLLQILSEKGTQIDLEAFEKLGSELLNLSTKQIQIEIDQRNTIKQLSTSLIDTNDQNKKMNRNNYKIIRNKLTVLNTLILTMNQEMRAFKRRLPIFFEKYKKRVLTENSKIIEKISIECNQKVEILQNALSKYQTKYQKMKAEKSQNESLFEVYVKQLKTTQEKLENSNNENIENLKERLNSQSKEINSLKKQIELYKEQIQKDQQKINELTQVIKNDEEKILTKIQNLMASQKVIKKLKDEYEKVAFVINEINSIDENNKSSTKTDDIQNKIKFIKSKINSKNFETKTIIELKETCQQLIFSKDQIKQDLKDIFSDASNLKRFSVIVEICSNLTLQGELQKILAKLNEKIKNYEINSENTETIKKLLKQLSKKTKENQRLSIINQKLQNQKDDLQQQIGDIKMQLRSNPSFSPFLTTSSRFLFSPSKSQNSFSRTNIDVNSTPKFFTKSEIINVNNNNTFDDSESPISNRNLSYNYVNKNKSKKKISQNNFNDNDEGDDEGESELFDN